MNAKETEQDPYDKRNLSTIARWKILSMGLMLPLIIPTMPRSAEGMGRLLSGSDNSGIEITCSNPVMKSAPRFLSAPKGSAKYPFTSYCTSPSVPGAMTLRWEGSWTPSETRSDRPNASESITVTSYDGFIPDREPGGKIFMYWTGRCDRDPWLQPSTCDRFGGYVPPDVREALNQIDHERFPLTWKSISPSLKQQLVKDYQLAQTRAQRENQQVSLSSGTRQSLQEMKSRPQQSEAMISHRRKAQAMIQQPQQSQTMTIQPQATPPMPGLVEKPSAYQGLFSRGTEPPDPQQSAPPEQDAQTETAETTAPAVQEGVADEITGTAAITLDHPLHVITAKGDTVVIEPGIYEIEPILDLQLGLAREGQPTLILHANPDTHSESIRRTMALVIPGQSNDEQHLVLLTPDGNRFDALGSTSGVTSRGTGMVTTLSDKTLKDAVIAASAQSASEPPPPCQQNPVQTGPRWIPVPCTMPSIAEIPTAPVP